MGEEKDRGWGKVAEKGENSEENYRGGVVKKEGYDILNIGKEVRGGIQKYEFKVLNLEQQFYKAVR